MRLIVGLGNPGENYKDTRHNVGFMAVDEIIDRHNFSSPKAKASYIYSEANINNEKVMIVKPTVYMNNSGRSVAEISKFYKIPPGDIIVIHDDLDLPVGKVKMKIGGGHGGHNGLRSIDSTIGKEYQRLRIGIGHPGDKDLVADYVLHKFNLSDKKEITDLIELIANNFTDLINSSNDVFLNKLALSKQK